MGYLEDICSAEQYVMTTTAVYNASIADAAKRLQAAQSRYDKAVRAAEKKIKEAEKAFSTMVDACGGMTLYPDRVCYKKTALPLDRGIRVEVREVDDSTPPVYGTKLVITIDASNGRRIVGSSKDIVKGRKFAAQVMRTAVVAQERVAERQAGYPRLRADLEAARADTRELDAARAAYYAAVNDTTAVQQAQFVLDGLKANASQSELAAYEDAKRRKCYKHRAIAIAVILLAFLLLVAMVTCAVATIR